MQSSGKIYLAGAGPGDPDLLTVKARDAITQCDVLLYDRLVSPEILALANPAAELVYCGKHGGDQETVQPWILERMVSLARAGRIVVRLKGGDPCVFGRGGEEWQRLRAEGIDVELIPGISSSISVPGMAGIPVTFRGVSRAFAVVTGHCRQPDETDWTRYAAMDTLVILMGVECRAQIARSLIEAGRLPGEPVAFIERGTTPRERVVETTLEDVAAGRVEVEAPAVFVVGEVVRLREELTRVGTAAVVFA